MKTLLFFNFVCGLSILVTVADGVDEGMPVSVTEGDPVTLPTDLSEIQEFDQIVWMFGPNDTRIAHIHMQTPDIFDSYETFGFRLKMDQKNGSLTIGNIRPEHTGLYKRQVFRKGGTSLKEFNVTVYAQLPIPVIKSNSSNCSSPSNCSLLCSVVNVSHATLSWLKGNSLLSKKSASNLSIGLSLPLEVENQDESNYSCVINNPIKNQTTHLDISALCESREDTPKRTHVILLVPVLLLLCFMVAYKCVRCCMSEKRGMLSEESSVSSDEKV